MNLTVEKSRLHWYEGATKLSIQRPLRWRHVGHHLMSGFGELVAKKRHCTRVLDTFTLLCEDDGRPNHREFALTTSHIHLVVRGPGMSHCVTRFHVLQR